MIEPEEGAATPRLPVGTVTFLRSDLEGSMDLVRSLGRAYDELNSRHQAIVRVAILGEGGQVVRTEGDAFFAVFTDAAAAVRTAQTVQRAMAANPWPPGHEFKVRIGLHAGTAYRAGDDYGGLEVSRAARIAALGWGGQVILSEAVRGLLAGSPPDTWAIRDLGLHRLKGIIDPEHIYQLDVPGLSTDFPLLASRADSAAHLPRPVTRLIGREEELELLDELLARTRLLTLSGPGGAGKSTLALELARRHAAEYGDGAWFVDLQEVSDAALVTAEIAHGLSILDGATGPAADRLQGFVAERELLIVIDNLEQVIDAADAIGELIEASPRSRVIATSRIPLRLAAEQEYVVHPLGLGSSDGAVMSDASRLFIDRARRVRPELRIEREDLDTIGEICRLVDGLPLAIELCAARVSGMPIGLIRDRIAARRALPGMGTRDLPGRQRTIEETVAWSYDLLQPDLQAIFASLGAFAPTFDLEQAEEVILSTAEPGVDVLDGLYALVEQSLLFSVEDAVGGVRFGMLETIHAFAAARLRASGDDGAIGQRHAVAYADLASRAATRTPGPDQARWLDRLEADASNLRTATTFAIDAVQVDLAFRLVSNQWRSWLATGRLVEGRSLVSRALELPGAEAATPLRIWALDAAGGIAYWSGDLDQAAACYEKQLALADELGDVRGQAWGSYNLYYCRVFGGDLTGSSALIDVAQRLFERLDDAFGLASVEEARSLPLYASAVADPEAGRSGLVAAVARYEAGADRNPALRTMARSARAFIRLLDGDAAGALPWIVATLPDLLARREPANMALGLRLVPAGLLQSGRAEAAATVHGGVEAAHDRLGIQLDFLRLESVSPNPMYALTEALGQARTEAALERGRRMSLEELAEFIEASIEDPVPRS